MCCRYCPLSYVWQIPNKGDSDMCCDYIRSNFTYVKRRWTSCDNFQRTLLCIDVILLPLQCSRKFEDCESSSKYISWSVHLSDKTFKLCISSTINIKCFAISWTLNLNNRTSLNNHNNFQDQNEGQASC